MRGEYPKNASTGEASISRKAAFEVIGCGIRSNWWKVKAAGYPRALDVALVIRTNTYRIEYRYTCERGGNPIRENKVAVMILSASCRSLISNTIAGFHGANIPVTIKPSSFLPDFSPARC